MTVINAAESHENKKVSHANAQNKSRHDPCLVDEGLSAQEIADRMGWTVGTLRVRSSQLKISLRRSAIWKSPSHIYLAVPKAIFRQLQQHATLIGISESELATDLLKTIVQDDLCKAVLDRDATELPQWTKTDSANNALMQ